MIRPSLSSVKQLHATHGINLERDPKFTKPFAQDLIKAWTKGTQILDHFKFFYPVSGYLRGEDIKA